MKDPTVHSQSPASLVRLLRLQEEAATWSATDLAAILSHQLAAPLEYDLGDFATAERRNIEDMTHVGEGARLRTFGDVLFHRHPPIELLKLIKDFAKSGREQEGSVPRETATLLYYLAVAVARARLGERISSLSDGDLRGGIAWALRQSWIDQRTRALLLESLGSLGG